MSDLIERLAGLSPKKRELFLQQLKQKKAVSFNSPKIVHCSQDSGHYPLSFAQQGLWFFHQLEPGTSIYNIPPAVRLQGHLNISALERSLNEIAKRHEALRTNFTTIDGQPVQIVSLPKQFTLSVVDLQKFPEPQRETQINQLATEEALQPFNLEQDSLWRVKLLHVDDQEYLLLLTMHHIISDGWSMGVLLKEMVAFYDAFANGKAISVPELPIQYRDFAVWQQQWLQGEILETQLSYWKQQLMGASPMLLLPTDRPRPRVQTFQGSKYSFRLSLALTEALQTFSQQSGVTLFMTLLASFQTLLYRYTQQDDISVGCPLANRRLVETEPLIGMFVNTLVMRTNLSGNPSFRELIERVRLVTLAAYAHQDLPFEKLVEELQPERYLSHRPLFQVAFALQNFPTPDLKLPGLDLNWLEIDLPSARFDLTAIFIEEVEGLRAWIEYNTDLFDTQTIAQMVGHFQTILESIVANPDQRLSNLPLLTPAEQHQLLGEWNRGKSGQNLNLTSNLDSLTLSSNKCLHQLFEEQVEKTPETVAVVWENQQLTYKQLNQRANQLAHYLQKLGVKPEVLVGLCVEPSLDLLVGILGILKAGGAYVPINLTHPGDRLTFILEDSQIFVLLTQQLVVESLSNYQAEIVCLDADWEAIACESEYNPTNKVTTDNLSYLIYTSGSTGKPKGVLVKHANVTHLFAATQSWFNFNSDDVWTLFHSYDFNFSVWEIWGALLYGGRLVVVPYWISRSPETFYNLLCKERVTVLNQTPSAFYQLIQVEEFSKITHKLSLRLAILGGEALDLQSLKPWFEQHGDRSPQLVNMYGSSETTVYVTYRPLTKADLNSTRSLIGSPIPDLQLYLIDRHLQLLPIGVPGEIYVGGTGLARGYFNRPDLTAERFIANPFSNQPGERLYKTGDLARYLPNGDIEYLGRLDDQVKIRGFCIDMGEIESVLVQHPAVRKSVVMYREDVAGEKHLVAYFIPEQKSAPTVNEIRSFLQEKLPYYMMPSSFVLLKPTFRTSFCSINTDIKSFYKIYIKTLKVLSN